MKRLLEAVVRIAKQQGTAVLLVEQHVRKALEYCDRAYVMHRGRIELSGTADELLGRLGEIEDRYLTAATTSGPAWRGPGRRATVTDTHWGLPRDRRGRRGARVERCVRRMKMKAAVLWEPQTDWSVEEVELDPPKAGEVLVQLVGSGLCHSDEHLLTGDLALPAEPRRRWACSSSR